MEPTNKTADVFMRAMRMMEARRQGAGGFAILTAMLISATRQMYLREVEGETREKFDKEIIELSWEMDPHVDLGMPLQMSEPLRESEPLAKREPQFLRDTG